MAKMLRGDSDKVQHLLRRAAFGCNLEEWPKWATLSPERALSKLVDYDAIENNVAPLPVDAFGNLITGDDVYQLRRYWLYRLCESSRPLEETMTLFWHGHFATADYKVQNGNLMFKQNEFLRKNAMGSFKTLLRGVATDPAMLVWLDGNQNRSLSPNENFSRELLELFALGVDGGYTETDVKEGARAYAGWSYDDDRNKLRFELEYADVGIKNYLGQHGNWRIDQAIDIVAHHPSTARFVSKKLYEFFVNDDPPKEELDRLADVYFKSKLSIREVVRAVLGSPYFYSDEAVYSRIKSPVQYTVMTVKTLDIPFRWINNLQDYTDSMGQQLFDPPNVKGWRPGTSWINTNTMTARLNFAGHAVDQLRYRGQIRKTVSKAIKQRGGDPDKIFDSPETAVAAVADWILPGTVLSEPTERALVGYMKSHARKNANRDFYWDRSVGLVELVLTCPEYQLA